MQTREFIVVRHFLAYIHSLQPPNRVRVPLSWSFNQASNLFTIGLWFQFTLLDFWLQAPFTLLKRYLTLEQHLKWYLSLEKIPLKDNKDWSHKNHSNRTLGSKIQEKLGLNGALKICKLWNNGALKNTLLMLKYNQEWFGKVKLMKQWRLKPFYRRKKSN